MQYLRCTAELLAPLKRLTSLRKLQLCPVDRPSEGLEVVRQLTGLRYLHLVDRAAAEGLLQQLTQLEHLTRLYYSRAGLNGSVDLRSKVR
jgi:hypothetical protein